MTDQHTEDRVSDATPEGQIPDPTPEGDIPDATPDEPETFPRDYVEKLRDENAKYRQRAGQADELAKRLHRLMVERTGRLADADDLPFDQAHLDDEDALNTAIEDLLARKPHLASRRVVGDVGQGVTDNAPPTSPRSCDEQPTSKGPP